MISSLKTRLMVQIAMMGFAVALAGGAGVWGVNGLHADFSSAREGYRQLRSAYEIGVEVAVARAALAAATPDRQQAQQALRRATVRISLEQDERPAAFWQPVAAALADADRALEQGQLSPADEAIRQVMGELSRLTTQARLRIDHSAEVAARRRRQALGAVAALGGLALVLVTAVGLLQYRSVVQPLHRVAAGVRTLRRRDFSRRIEPTGDREFRDLARDFNAMADELHELYTELEQRVAAKSQELARAARLASVGYLAAGVAHEINNPLSIIAGYGERSLRQLDRDAAAVSSEPVREALKIVCEEAFRCRQITNRLLSLARPDDSPRGPLRLSQVVREVTASLAGLPAFTRATVRVEVDDEEPPVLAAAGEMKQVVLNLLINALQAVRDSAEPRITIGIAPRGAGVRLAISDNGVGMSEQVLQQVFEPFFTHGRRQPDDGSRAADGAGVGLGLAIAHAIVRDHAGRITAESDGPGRGSRFTIELPAMQQEATP